MLRQLLRLLVLVFFGSGLWAGEAPKLRVVTTLPDYAFIARWIGGERVQVSAIVLGDQDAHFIRPKPSFVAMVREADVVVGTGLDLELWLPVVIDKSGNAKVRSGQIGFVAASDGIELLEKPALLSRQEGGVHIYGNPHITTSPLNMKIVARNIAAGLIRNDPEGREFYLKNLKRFNDEIDKRLFGPELVRLLGSATLERLASKGKLLDFLERYKFKGKRLIDYLGGWMQLMYPLRGTPIVTYHKNWVYFFHLFGLREAGTVEPKPGIPPSAKHVAELLGLMRAQGVKIVLAANYFDPQRVRSVARGAGAEAVIVPLYVGGEPGVKDYFSLVDLWINRLRAAARKTGLLKENQS